MITISEYERNVRFLCSHLFEGHVLSPLTLDRAYRLCENTFDQMVKEWGIIDDQYREVACVMGIHFPEDACVFYINDMRISYGYSRALSLQSPLEQFA